MFINGGYQVFVSEYAKKHYINRFKRKYSKIWDETFKVIENMLFHIDNFLLTSKANVIHICETGQFIVKCEFKIIGSNESPKTSWNRIIVFCDKNKKECTILLIYNKTDFWWNWETAWWTKTIKENHKEFCKFFPELC